MSTLGLEFLKAELSGEQKEKLDSYLNSPLYYMITGRRGAWLYKSHNSALIVCRHPHIDDRLMVFPEIGKADYALTVSVLNMLSVPENGVQLARHTEQDIMLLKQQWAKQSRHPVSDISVIEEETMDWYYPVRIVDTNTVSAMNGKAFAQVRTKFNKAAGDGDIKAVELTLQNGLRFMRAALKFWEGNMIANGKDTEDVSEFYHAFFDIVKEYPDSYEALLFMQGRRPVGLSVWEELSASTANSFISICDTTIGGLSDFQMVSTCRALNAKGVKYLNLGGSETQNLDAFKEKYRPAKSVSLVSAEVIYARPANTNIQVCQIV